MAGQIIRAEDAKIYDLIAVPAIRWTHDVDETDEKMFNTTIKNMWLPSDHAVGDDRPDWVNKMKEEERITQARVFAGLTRLDSLQSMVGVDMLIQQARSPIEQHVYKTIECAECIHVKSYSHIFIELTGDVVADEFFDWVDNHPTMIEKAALIRSVYVSKDPYKVKIASVALESFLFFTGFYYTFWLAAHKKVLPETASVIRAIVRDEATHGYYIGYKYQQILKDLDEDERAYYAQYAEDIFLKLYDIETRYTEDLYADVGLVDDVQRFLCYNANKGMQNLGYEDLFPEEMCYHDAAVRAALDAADVNDFFSNTSASYKQIARVEGPDEMWSSGVI